MAGGGSHTPLEFPPAPVVVVTGRSSPGRRCVARTPPTHAPSTGAACATAVVDSAAASAVPARGRPHSTGKPVAAAVVAPSLVGVRLGVDAAVATIHLPRVARCATAAAAAPSPLPRPAGATACAPAVTGGTGTAGRLAQAAVVAAAVTAANAAAVADGTAAAVDASGTRDPARVRRPPSAPGARGVNGGGLPHAARLQRSNRVVATAALRPPRHDGRERATASRAGGPFPRRGGHVVVLGRAAPATKAHACQRRRRQGPHVERRGSPLAGCAPWRRPRPAARPPSGPTAAAALLVRLPVAIGAPSAAVAPPFAPTFPLRASPSCAPTARGGGGGSDAGRSSGRVAARGAATSVAANHQHGVRCQRCWRRTSYRRGEPLDG